MNGLVETILCVFSKENNSRLRLIEDISAMNVPRNTIISLYSLLDVILIHIALHSYNELQWGRFIRHFFENTH